MHATASEHGGRLSVTRRADTAESPRAKNSAPQDSYHLWRAENDPLSSVPNGSTELVPLDGEEGAGGVTSCGNVARHRKQTRFKRPKPQAYPLRSRLQKRF